MMPTRRSWATAVVFAVALLSALQPSLADEEQTEAQTTTPEPDASPGCKAPDIRFNVIKPESGTEAPFAKFETTPGSLLPDDDGDFGERINIDLSSHAAASAGHSKTVSSVINPYQVDLAEHPSDGVHDDHIDGVHDHDDDDDDNDDEDADDDDDDFDDDGSSPGRGKYDHRKEHGDSRKRKPSSGRRHRVENENGNTRGRGSRYKRQAVRIHHDPDASPDTDKWSGSKLAAEGDVYYIHIDDILKTSSPNAELRLKLHKLKKKKNKKQAGDQLDDCDTDKQQCVKRKHKKASSSDMMDAKEKPQPQPKGHHRRRGDSHEEKRVPLEEEAALGKRSVNPRWRRSLRNSTKEEEEAVRQETAEQMAANGTELVAGAGGGDGVGDGVHLNGTADGFQRVKRKSGKTTGALSRPKGGSDSSSKTTSRKDKGAYEEEGGYSPVHPDETDSDEEEEESEEIDIHQQFTEVSEIRFPGEIGPLGDRRLCKIRCVKGKWVGPLCATNEEDDNGNVNFQPLYKSCHVNRMPPHLLLSYRNISVTPIPNVRGRRNRTSKPTFVSNTPINVGWDLPHGHSLQARCQDIGLYKLLGESRVLCSNGLWAPRMPSCVPTTLLTNFSDDSAPSIRIRVLNGSGAFEPSGVLAVLPKSTILLDCYYPRVRGIPEWTWTSWYMQYPTGWVPPHDEKGNRYRLTIKDIQTSDSGTFTCTSPRGLTNSVPIVVATSTCPQLPEPVAPLALRLEGNKLGQRAMYRCPPGYRIEGVANATCLASGNWSTPPPTCQAVRCPRLLFDDPHLSILELNTSAWGRAVFKCQWGFRLTGPPGLDCQPTGVWSGPVPRCKDIQCPMPVVPLNGRIGGSNLNQHRMTVGALITFSCNEGHTLIGEQSIICSENGNWSHDPPFCQSQCPYPGDPPNGLIAPLKFNYDSGDYLDVQCRPGFVLHGENGPVERPLCQPNGNWSVPVPKCRSYEEV